MAENQKTVKANQIDSIQLKNKGNYKTGNGKKRKGEEGEGNLIGTLLRGSRQGPGLSA